MKAQVPYLLLGIGLLLFSIVVAAQTTDLPGGVFDAPTQVSMYNVWSFSYRAIPTNRFDETKVFLGPSGANLTDEKYLIGTFYNNGAFSPNPLFGKGIVSYFTRDERPGEVDGLTVYVTYIGLDVGEYALLALAYDDKLLKDTAEAKLTVINPAGKAQADETSQKLTETTTELESLKESKDQITKKFNDLLTITRQSYEEMDGQLNDLSETLASLQNRTTTLDEQTKTALTEMQSTIKSTQGDLRGLIQENENEKEAAAKAGFLNLSLLSQYGPQALIGLVIVLVLVGGALFWKNRSTESNLFSDSDLEHNLGGGNLGDWGKAKAKPSAGTQSSGAVGRWSTGGAGAASRTSSRATTSGSSRKFGMGSFIRK